MQRTLIIFNTIVLVAVGLFIFPIFFEVRELRADFERTPNAISLDTMAEALVELDSRTDRLETQLTETMTSVTRLMNADPGGGSASSRQAVIIDHIARLEAQASLMQEALDTQREDFLKLVTAMLTQTASSPGPGSAQAMDHKTHNKIQQLQDELKNRQPIQLPVAPDERLSGIWRLTLPAGYQQEVTIQDLGNNRFKIATAGTLGGEYKRYGKALRVEKPNNPRIDTMTWKIDSPYRMHLTEAPPTGAVGSDYTGAVLERSGPER